MVGTGRWGNPPGSPDPLHRSALPAAARRGAERAGNKRAAGSLKVGEMTHELHEVDRLLQEIRIRVRQVEGLRRRGASKRELEAARGEVDRLQWRLADLVSTGRD